MTKKVVVTSAQRAAARAMVEWSALKGREVSDSVRKIAEAKPVNGVARSRNAHPSPAGPTT